MRIHSLLGTSAAAIGALMLAPAASAQEADGFQGFYVGGSVGYGFQNNDGGETIVFDRNGDGDFSDVVTTTAGANAFSPGYCNGLATGNAPAAGCRNDDDDIEYHGRIGYDMQYGNFVVGVVVEGGRSQVRDAVTGFSTTPASYSMIREIDYDVSARLRAGYAAGGTTLFYATGGPAYARIDNDFQTTNGANAFTGGEKTDSWGFAVGGGVEQKLGRNISVGVEYLYSRYTQDDYSVTVTQGTAPATNPFLLGNGETVIKRSDDRFDFHAIRATAAFRF